MKKINLMLRRCKTLSRQLIRTSSYTSLRSKSTTDHHHLRHGPPAETGGIMWNSTAVCVYGGGEEPRATVFVGSTRKRYVIGSKYLSHPLVIALTEKEKSTSVDGDNAASVINCEVVLFDHLLWMLENSDLNINSDSLDELAALYIS
ncbi:auxin-responsive protein SAUR76 [Lactuca sativa]|uniref:auxin-responsive protein SAUR76 n=1 Tax=Lactuca sativa TaxID=4236 RepID=UPI000CCA30F5|nr:auxin-responsive protein SAUR76 [Lactuca sativa]